MKWFYLAIIIIFVLSIILMSCKADSGREGTGGSYDYSNPKAPKTIVSTEITSFEYTFVTDVLNQWYSRNIPYRRCTFSLVREEDGARCIGSGYSDSDASFDFAFLAPLAALDDLQALVHEHNLAQVNGINKGAIAIPEEFLATRLKVRYASGETISASDNSGPILNGANDTDIYDFFMTLAQELDSDFVLEHENFWEPHKVLQGRLESEDGTKALVFDTKEVSIFEDGELIECVRYYVSRDKVLRSGIGKNFVLYRHFYWSDNALRGDRRDGGSIKFVPKP